MSQKKQFLLAYDAGLFYGFHYMERTMNYLKKNRQKQKQLSLRHLLM